MEDARKRYVDALHAMQTGVAMKLAVDPSGGSPKHLRTGLNGILCDHAALARLLMAKGVISDEEYLDAIAQEMEAEVRRYENELTSLSGFPVHLL